MKSDMAEHSTTKLPKWLIWSFFIAFFFFLGLSVLISIIINNEILTIVLCSLFLIFLIVLPFIIESTGKARLAGGELAKTDSLDHIKGNEPGRRILIVNKIVNNPVFRNEHDIRRRAERAYDNWVKSNCPIAKSNEHLNRDLQEYNSVSQIIADEIFLRSAFIP